VVVFQEVIRRSASNQALRAAVKVGSAENEEKASAVVPEKPVSEEDFRQLEMNLNLNHWDRRATRLQG
jgi:hypothetical protein